MAIPLPEDLSEADLIVVNTCTFIEKAKAESINTILEVAQYKEDGCCKGLIVAGVLANNIRMNYSKKFLKLMH